MLFEFLFGAHFGEPFGHVLDGFCCFSLEVSRGPLRGRFWLRFWIILPDLKNIVGVMLEVIFRRTWFYLHARTFSKVSIYVFVCFPLVHISKIAVLLLWEINFREFA